MYYRNQLLLIVNNQLILHHLVNADLSAVNHPVHIITKDKQMSPSALIPFCEFGGDMSKVGVMIDHFEIPVCNSFESKIMNDQLWPFILVT